MAAASAPVTYQYRTVYRSPVTVTTRTTPWRTTTTTYPTQQQTYYVVKKERSGTCGGCNACGCCDPGAACEGCNRTGCFDRERKVLRRKASQDAIRRRMEAELPQRVNRTGRNYC